MAYTTQRRYDQVTAFIGRDKLSPNPTSPHYRFYDKSSDLSPDFSKISQRKSFTPRISPYQRNSNFITPTKNVTANLESPKTRSKTNLYLRGFNTTSFATLLQEQSYQIPNDTIALIKQGINVYVSLIAKSINLETFFNVTVKPSSHGEYAFIDFDDSHDADTIELQLIQRMHDKHPDIQISRAHSQETDPNNVYFRNLPDFLRNIDEKNAADRGEDLAAKMKKNQQRHQSNEQELVLEAVILIVLGIKQNELDAIKSVRVLSDQVGTDELAACVRFKQTHDAMNCIKHFKNKKWSEVALLSNTHCQGILVQDINELDIIDVLNKTARLKAELREKIDNGCWSKIFEVMRRYEVSDHSEEIKMIVKSANSNLGNNPLSPFLKPGPNANREEKEFLLKQIENNMQKCKEKMTKEKTEYKLWKQVYETIKAYDNDDIDWSNFIPLLENGTFLTDIELLPKVQTISD